MARDKNSPLEGRSIKENVWDTAEGDLMRDQLRQKYLNREKYKNINGQFSRLLSN